MHTDVEHNHAQLAYGDTKKTDFLGNMISSPVDLLVEKGFITQEEYEKRIKQKVKIVGYKNRSAKDVKRAETPF